MIEPYKKLAARLNQSQLKRDEPLAPYTTFRIGGPADLLYNATAADDLAIAVQSARESSRRTQCSNNMRQIGIGLHNYEAAYKRWPAGKKRWLPASSPLSKSA